MTAQLPKWANELTEEVLRAILRSFGLNTSGADGVLRERVLLYNARRKGNQAVPWYSENEDPQEQVPQNSGSDETVTELPRVQSTESFPSTICDV